jgi:pyruvate dehydrogenase E2 component (dihydrolipoamide acetyltransferase)
MAVEFFIHKMSEHMEAAQILKWRVKEGDRVEKFQVVLEVMTDKVNAEIESPEAGVIKGIRPGAVEGATVPIGEPICYIAAADEVVPPLPPLPGHEPPTASAEARGDVEATPSPGGNPIVESGVTGVRATPIARRVAKELGIDITKVVGTGPLGRISEMDVRAYAEGHRARASTATQPTAAPAPAKPFAQSPDDQV